MGFLIFIFMVAVVTMVVFVIMSQNGEPTATQMELAEKMYGPKSIDFEMECAKIEALIQAAEAGHDDVHQQIEDGTYKGPWPEHRGDGAWTSIFDDLRILSIAGINHRQNISHYKGRNTVALVPDPKNEFDPNAIKVIAEDGHHLGYIQRHQTEMVRSWAHDKFPHYCICMIQEHDDEDDGHRFYTGYIYFKKL